MKGGHHGHHGRDHHGKHDKDLRDSREEHHGHKKGGCQGGRGGPFGLSHGTKEAIASVFMWLLFVGPLLCLMRKVAWLRQKIAKINKSCN